MGFKTIIGLVIILISCACNQQPSSRGLKSENGSNQQFDLKTGLKIVNRGNRGARFTDSEGTDYWLINIASTITNDNPIPLHIQLELLNEYDFPIDYGDQKFNIFLLPQAFALDGIQIVTDQAVLTDSMQVEFQNYLKNDLDTPYKFDRILEPGEKCVLAIGTLYPDPPKNCDIFPNVLFAHTDDGLFPKCNWLMEEDTSASLQIALGLKLNICQGGPQEIDGNNYSSGCMIIHCGHISHPEG